MILPCPACQARFMVPDDRITPRGIKIRCPKCRFVFIMKAQKRSVAAAAAAPTAASGSIGGAQPAPKKKTPRKRLPEAEAAKLSRSELAAIEDEEIVDMDDLAQATEQSGTAFNPNIKAEHFEPVQPAGPSVMIDDSLMAAAAAHSASWTEEPTAPENIPRISPAAAVTDTWIDLPGQKSPTLPPVPQAPPPQPAASGSIGAAAGSIGAASGSIGATSGSIGEPTAASGSIGEPTAASGSIGELAPAAGSIGEPTAAAGSIGELAPAAGSIGEPAAASGSIGEPAAASGSIGELAPASGSIGEPAAEAGPDAAEADLAQPPALPALEDTSDTMPGVMSPFFQAPPAEAAPPAPTPAAAPAAGPVASGVMGSVLPGGPAAPAADDDDDIDIDIDLEEPEEAPALADPSRFEMSYTLSAATSFTEAELAELEEYEGLLVEERRALRKGPGATFLLILFIALGIGVLGALGYLGWQVLNPPKKKPPAWGHLQLSQFEHNLVERKGRPPLVVATVNVKNGSPKAKFRNVHVRAKLLSGSGELRCQGYAPCGPRFAPAELGSLEEGEYHKVIRVKSKSTAYNVQLNPGQDERCQVVLFCGASYQAGSDRVQITVDQEHSERVME